MNDTPTPETDEAAGDLTGINLSAAFETKCRQLEIEKNRLTNFARDLERQLAELTDRWERAANAYLIERGKHEETQRQLADATREIDILRRYGNKDCTAMADDELARLQREEQPNALAQGQCAGVLEMYYRQPLPNPPTENP